MMIFEISHVSEEEYSKRYLMLFAFLSTRYYLCHNSIFLLFISVANVQNFVICT